jgi:SAM-dependent methyltransferase
MKEKLLRLAALSTIADGILLALFGRRYARLWRLGTEEGAYYRIARWFATRPQWLLRLLGLGEVAAGVKVMGRAPLSVPSIYNTLAVPYSAIDTWWRGWLYAEAHRAFDGAIAWYLPEDGEVLDLGAGTGANLGRLLEMGIPFASYSGVDHTEGMLEQARAKYAHLPQVHFRQLDLVREPLPKGRFDLIVSTWALEHIAQPGDVVGKAWQHLRPGGHMVLLFEVEGTGWYSELVNRVLGFFDAQQVADVTVKQFPGLKRYEIYSGPFANLAFVLLEKQMIPAGQK